MLLLKSPGCCYTGAILERHHGYIMWDYVIAMLWLLHQPGDRLCCGCHATQERINLSSVPTSPCIFFQSLSSNLAYTGSSKECVQHEQQGSWCHKQDQQDRESELSLAVGHAGGRMALGQPAAVVKLGALHSWASSHLSSSLPLTPFPVTPAEPLPGLVGSTLTPSGRWRIICSMRTSSGTTGSLGMCPMATWDIWRACACMSGLRTRLTGGEKMENTIRSFQICINGA